MTLRQILNLLLTIKQRFYPDLTPEEREALDKAVTILAPLAMALEGV